MKPSVILSLISLTLCALPATAAPLTQADRLYTVRLDDNLKYLTSALHEFSVLTEMPEFASGHWRTDRPWQIKFAAALTLMHLCAEDKNKLHPTPRFQRSNRLYIKSLTEFDALYATLPLALDKQDEMQQLESAKHLINGQAELRRATNAFISSSKT